MIPLKGNLEIMKMPIAEINLNELMNVECSMDSILLYGRYVKLSREISQTPWLLGDKEIVL